MKIYLNTAFEQYGLPTTFVKYLTKMGLREGEQENHDCVFNIDSIDSKGFKKGQKCTVYLEGDEFITKGRFKECYNQSDIFYILQKNYLPFYPEKTKIMKLGIDMERIHTINIEKTYDYVFVGRMHGSPVYDNRINTLEELKKSKYKILTTEGTPETYCELMSSGRIILNILPRIGEDVCVNRRILEGMVMGCMMTDYHPAIDDLGIKPNVHYLTLDRFGDISDEEIKRVHEAGLQFVKDNYTVEHDIKTLISDIEDFTGEKVC